MTPRAPALLAVAVVLGAVLPAARAHAAAREAEAPPAPRAATLRLAVFPFEGFDLPKSLEMSPMAAFDTVSKRLAADGHTVSEPPLTLRDMIVALDCKAVDGPCARKMGENLSVDRVVVGKIYRGDDGLFLRVRIFACAEGALAFQHEEKVPTDAASVAAAMKRTAEAVAEAATNPVVTTPAGDSGGGGRRPGPAALGLLGAGGAVLVGAVATGLGLAATVSRINGYERPYDLTAVNSIEALITSGQRLVVATAVLGGIGAAVLGAGVVLTLAGGKAKEEPALGLGLTPDGGPAVVLRWSPEGLP